MKTRKNKSLIKQLIQKVLLIALISIFGLGSTIVLLALNRIDSVHKQMLDSNVEAVRAFDEYFIRLKASILAASNLLQATNDVQYAILQIASLNPSIVDILIMNQQGEINDQYHAFGRPNVTQYEYPELLKMELKFSEISFSQIAYEEEISTIDILTPLFDELGIQTGILMVRVDLTELWNTTLAIQVGESGYAYIVDSEGYLISHRNRSYLVNRNLTLKDLLGRTPESIANTELQFYRGLQNKWVFASGQSLNVVPWFAIVEQPIEEALFSLLIPAIVIVFILGAVLFLVYDILVFFRHRIVSPLHKLSAAIENTKRGEAIRNISLSTNDEFSQLAKVLVNTSLDNANLYHTLEQKVEERTAELECANQEIGILNEKLKAENIRLSSEIEIAKTIQKMVLPKPGELKNISCLDIAGYMEPADEVGGDYYDVLQQGDHLKISIGDVTGHGLESGVLMLMTQTVVRTLQKVNQTNPVEFLDVLNQTLYDNLQRMNCDKNMTLSILDYHDGVMTLSGQHEHLILVRLEGEVEIIDTIDLGFPIGLDGEIRQFISQQDIHLNRGDVVVLYTDGITEAANMDRVQYGLEQLCTVVVQHRDKSAEGIRERVIQDVREFIGKQKVFDDITLVVIKQK
ncbi:SpoIIE family protein phosphatase [Roseofilum capinflatum]|uniref:SpoIIE family protein phosphatase n=1 Tax=Roseofilum capinflatum BLCC-M114 TaxID=3022440 RepID=A0ABT7B3C2_9CYAN|nr:SpoIIE family protein phosphatase [Roseofilum capinflatum]MDJ1173683.1 SpoIIE family protein phosphatase [Roseofilum capinflatum BLCC-M114]